MSYEYIPFTPGDAAILLIDHQPGVMAMIKSVDATLLAANVGLLARLGEQMKIPLVVATTRETLDYLGTSIPAIQTSAPKAYAARVRRAGTLDAFADPAFVQAVVHTGRRNLIIAGILTDVCLFNSTMSAIKAGYTVWLAADACGTGTALGDQVTYERLRAAGATVATTLGVLFELYPNLSSAEGQHAEAIATGDVKVTAKSEKGYWIGNSDISDLDGLQRYRDANRKVMTQFGAKFIVMHGQQQVPEGTSRSAQTLVEFPNYQAAVDCYNHPDYQKAAEIRHKVSVGSMVIVEGYSGRQDF